MKITNSTTKEQLLKEIELLQKENSELKLNKDFTRLIAENTDENVAILSFDLNAKYLYVCPSVKQVHGYSPDEMIGHSFFEFIHPEDKKKLQPIIKKYLTKIVKKVLKIDDVGISEEVEFRFNNKAGIWCHMGATVNVAGKYIVAIGRDITTTKQEIQEAKNRESYLSALSKASKLLLEDDDIPFQEFVNIIGKVSNSSRTYIFKNHYNDKKELLTSQVAEYCAAGNNPEINNPELQNLPFNKWIPRWEKVLSAGNIINGKIASFPDIERELFEPQDIQAILIIPITANNKFWGFIGFDNCTSDREWTTDEQDYLKTAGKNLEQEIFRNNFKKQLEADNFRFQATLDELDAVVYVADMTTYELLFLNKKGKNLTGNKVGMKCYEALQKGQTKPCNFCTNNLLIDKKGNPKNAHIWEFQNTITNNWYQCNDKAIKWTDGRLVRLEIATDITRSKQAEQKLLESEKQYRQLFEVLPYGGEVIDKNGIIINCSPSSAKMLGYKVSDLIGEHITNFVDEASIKLFKKYFPVLLSGKPLSLEVGMIRKDGGKLNILRAAQPIIETNGNIESILALNVDITKRKKAEEEVIKLSKLVMQSPTLIAISDVSGNLEFVNNKFTELSGYTSKEVIGKNPRILKSGLHKEEFYKDLWDTISSGEEWFGEFYNKKKNGEFYWEAANVFPLFDNNESIISYVKESEDITNRKKSEETLQKQTKELIEHNLELDAFSHTVAHDLKNPISQITGFSGLLKDGYHELHKDTIFNYLDKIIKSADKTNQIINSLLLFANVRKSDVKTEKINMAYIVNESLLRLTQPIEKSNAEIILPATWPTALGNVLWIEEVWVNYIINAIKYGGNPPKIEIGYNIEKTVSKQNKMVRFWINDNGSGISTVDKKLLFKKFERLDQANTQGHGLGLSIVKRIINKLDGQVGLESEKENGSLFYFTLPLSAETNIKEFISYDTISWLPRIEAIESANASQNKQLKILITEDDYTSHELLTIYLNDISSETLHARNGAEAVEICKQNPDIDLILMDIKMPIMNGYEATNEIRKFNKDVVIIAQTAYTTQGYFENAIKAGCNKCISKPIDNVELMKIIDRLVLG